METDSLYMKISESIRKEILNGQLKPGDRLLPVREMSEQWGCTPGTVQRAYKELAFQGLIISRPGQGTVVSGNPSNAEKKGDTILRKATLVNRMENFLLEQLTNGYDLREITEAMDIAQDRWKSMRLSPSLDPSRVLTFYGSHDMVMNGICSQFSQIFEGGAIYTNYCGSAGGLVALAAGEADLAGAHLWDAPTNTYNLPYIARTLPGRNVRGYTLAHRRIGFIVQSGNPRNIQKLQDLTQSGLTFVNRQSGSGTRVWLDAQLLNLNLSNQQITGFEDERLTHSDIARCVAENSADVGIGLESAAMAFGLDFVFLAEERYDLFMLEETMNKPVIQKFVDWLESAEAKKFVGRYRGYDCRDTGRRVS